MYPENDRAEAARRLERAPHVLLVSSWRQAGLTPVFGHRESEPIVDTINREFAEEAGVPTTGPGAAVTFTERDFVFSRKEPKRDSHIAYFCKVVDSLRELKALQCWMSLPSRWATRRLQHRVPFFLYFRTVLSVVLRRCRRGMCC